MPVNTLAENLTRLKDHYGWTQAEIAKRTGDEIDQKTVSRIIRGVNACTLTQLGHLAHAFDLLPWQLLVPGFDPKDPPVTQLTQAERDLYRKLRDIATDFGNLPD